MFYDERIENVKGSISRNAILLSFAVSFILGGIHLANIIINATSDRFFWFCVQEIAICVGALVALAVGFALGRSSLKDERTEARQNVFYSKAASVLIKYVLGVFALVMPIALYINSTGKPHRFADQGFGGIIYVLLFIIGIYVVYSFRKNDIYFNYSIIDNEGYYRCVLKNIGKIFLFALVLFGISAISFIGLVAIRNSDQTVIIKNFIEVIFYYIGSSAEVSALYLLYSFLEKNSYDSENSISKATVISLGITIFIYAVYTACVIFVDSQPIKEATAVQIVSIASTLDTYIKFALLIFLTYFGYEYQRICKNKILSAGCITILISETLSVFIGQIAGGLTFVYMPLIMSKDAYVINRIFSAVNVYIEDASSIANIVGFVLIIFALVKDKLISKAHRFSVGAFAVLCGVEVFLRTQVDILKVNIYHFLVEIILLCYLAILVVIASGRIKRMHQHRDL